jgi:hypothetical protein
MDKTKKRKGPGRPPKAPKVVPQPRDGISATPKSEDNVIEFKYCEPKFVRTIFTFFKNLATPQIQILFRKKSVIFYAQDHRERSEARIKVDCSKVHHYYCEKELNIGVNCKEIESLFVKLDTSYTAVILRCTRQEINKCLTVSLGTVLKIEEIHEVSVIGAYKELEDEKEFLDNSHKISMTFDGSYFKKTIERMVQLKAAKMMVMKYGNENLEMAYRRDNKRNNSKNVIQDPSTVNLVSKLGPREEFMVGVILEDLRPISVAYSASGKVRLYFDEDKRLMTESYLDDKTIEIRTLTYILENDEQEPDDSSSDSESDSSSDSDSD